MSEFPQTTVLNDRLEIIPVDERERLKRERLLERLRTYRSDCPEAEHLRPRQVVAMEEFCRTGSAMLSGEQDLERMAVIHPTGSGKTVLAAEMIRAVTEEARDVNVLMLVPSLRILAQTVGAHDDMGEIRRRVPGLSVGQYSGDKKDLGSQLTVMSYQMLRKAIKAGHIRRINPTLVICDEMHHIIDGSWAEDVQEVSEEALCVGLSATPAYSENRDSRSLFPIVLDRMTIREGIEDGILSDLKGYTYRGESRIKLTGERGELTDRDVFDALAKSKDNYLAAAICAKEVAQGKRGIVSCVPGFDRLHAKVMAKILSETKIKTAEGERHIRAAYIDGDMDADEIEEVLAAYSREEPDIDVITFVSLLAEGWNSPLTDFGVWLRPTPSKVLAEQRLGRLLRKRPGKVATVHEVLYEINLPAHLQPVTHTDVLYDDSLGRKYSVKSPLLGERDRSGSSKYSSSVDSFAVDESIVKEFENKEIQASEEINLTTSEGAVPYDWPTLYVLSTIFNIELAECQEIIEASDIEVYEIEVSGKIKKFYSPDVYKLLARHAGIEVTLPESHVKMSNILEHCRFVLSRIVDPKDVISHLLNQGISPGRCLSNNTVVEMYHEDVLGKLDGVPGEYAPSKKYRRKKEPVTPQVDSLKWLEGILIDPRRAVDPRHKRRIVLGQSCLLRAIADTPPTSISDEQRIVNEIEERGIEVSSQMQAVMNAKKINITRLVAAATHARIAHKKVE